MHWIGTRIVRPYSPDGGLVMKRLRAAENNRERLADLVYSLLRDSAPHLGIDLVRPPNPAHGDAVAVLFNDGQDVVITFTEKKS
jgi:hypothetical protein